MKYANLELGTVEAVFNKLGGLEAAQAFLRGELTVAPVIPREFPVYLEIEVGGKSRDQLLAEMKAAGIDVSSYADDIMSKAAWKPGEKQTVKFARVKVRDLDLDKNPTTAQIWARIKELGHSLCEPCDGPAIRLALKDQSRGDDFWCAMQQITNSVGSPGVFDVGRNDGKAWFRAPWVNPDLEWDLDDEVVFRLRK